jgi:hypothetical protein
MTVHGTTLTVVATLLGAGELQILTQRIEQRGARIHVDVGRATIDLERHGHGRRGRLSGALRLCLYRRCCRQRSRRDTAGDHATARHRKTFILMHIKSLYLLA